jgi:hypothetical protein
MPGDIVSHESQIHTLNNKISDAIQSFITYSESLNDIEVNPDEALNKLKSEFSEIFEIEQRED